MAGKLLKDTKDIDVKKRKTKSKIEDDNIYKIDFNDEIEDIAGKTTKAEEINADSSDNSNNNSSNIRRIEDDDDEIDEIFGNVNRWLTEDSLEKNLKALQEEEKNKKTKRKRLTKIEEGIRSSKVTKKAAVEAKTTAKDVLEESMEIIEEEKKNKTKTSTAQKAKKTAKTKTPATAAAAKTSTTRKRKIKADEEEDIYSLGNLGNIGNIGNLGDLENLKNLEKLKNLKNLKNLNEATEDYENATEGPAEIKMHTENDITEILLRNNRYKIELQKTEYNIYTETNETSYIIVRDPGLRIVSGGVYILLEKQGEDYEITTNQDFKINYVIDNLERKNNTVNFKLTNLTEIVADEDGLIFEIDEEKVIENNLEDNNTLVISEEDGKVYLPYTKEDVKNEVMQNKGTRISEVIEDKFILPLDKYKSSMRARFREGYNLMYRKEGKSRRSAIMLGIELMFETNLHPAIISACKNLEELDIYLDCLEDNELEKFSCFKIIYKSLPTLRKRAKFQEF